MRWIAVRSIKLFADRLCGAEPRHHHLRDWQWSLAVRQWQKIRESPSRIPAAINEILRMEAPIQCFSRLLTRNYDMDEITLPAGSRAIVFYGAANRDERKFPDPHRFDVTRGSAEHIAQTERAVVGRRSMQVTRMRITDAGRRALGELRWP
jgi:hypothetical protein